MKTLKKMKYLIKFRLRKEKKIVVVVIVKIAVMVVVIAVLVAVNAFVIAFVILLVIAWVNYALVKILEFVYFIFFVVVLWDF